MNATISLKTVTMEITKTEKSIISQTKAQKTRRKKVLTRQKHFQNFLILTNHHPKTKTKRVKTKMAMMKMKQGKRRKRKKARKLLKKRVKPRICLMAQKTKKLKKLKRERPWLIIFSIRMPQDRLLKKAVWTLFRKVQARQVHRQQIVLPLLRLM